MNFENEIQKVGNIMGLLLNSFSAHGSKFIMGF